MFNPKNISEPGSSQICQIMGYTESRTDYPHMLLSHFCEWLTVFDHDGLVSPSWFLDPLCFWIPLGLSLLNLWCDKPYHEISPSTAWVLTGWCKGSPFTVGHWDGSWHQVYHLTTSLQIMMVSKLYLYHLISPFTIGYICICLPSCCF